MGFRQNRHFPPSLIHPTIGTLSYHLSSRSHFGQCEGGVISDSPRGRRHTTTFRKLPMHAPSRKRKTMKTASCMNGEFRTQSLEFRVQGSGNAECRGGRAAARPEL